MTTTIWRAAYDGDVGELRRVLALGEPVNRENPWLETPLHLAAQQGHAEAVSVLLDAYVWVGLGSWVGFGGGWDGKSGGRGGMGGPLFLVCSGALVDARDKRRATPLLLASMCKEIPYEVVRRLLERGASVDLQDDDGRSPLSVAIEREDTVLVALYRGAEDVIPCPLGSGRAILRRLEGLYIRNVKSERDRSARLEAQALGLGYARDAPSQRVPRLIAQERRTKRRADEFRLSNPVHMWTAWDIAEFCWRIKEAPATIAPPRRMGEVGEVGGSEGDVEEEGGEGEGEGGDEGEGEEGGRMEGSEQSTHASSASSAVVDLEGGRSEGLPPSLRRRPSRPRGPEAWEWTSLDPMPDSALGGSVASWSWWMERGGVDGAVVALLGNHVSAPEAVRWMLRCSGMPVAVRRLAADALLERCKSDGSEEWASAKKSLPLCRIRQDHGGLMGSGAAFEVIGDVVVEEHDTLSDIRAKLGDTSTGCSFVLGASARPIEPQREARWIAMAAGFVIMLINASQAQQSSLPTRPPTSISQPHPSSSTSISSSLHPLPSNTSAASSIHSSSSTLPTFPPGQSPSELRMAFAAPPMVAEAQQWGDEKREEGEDDGGDDGGEEDGEEEEYGEGMEDAFREMEGGEGKEDEEVDERKEGGDEGMGMEEGGEAEEEGVGEEEEGVGEDGGEGGVEDDAEEGKMDDGEGEHEGVNMAPSGSVVSEASAAHVPTYSHLDENYSSLMGRLEEGHEKGGGED